MKGKGFVHIDYIIAVGIMIVLFALSVTFATEFVAPSKESSDVQTATSNAFSVSGIADFDSSPAVWNGTPERIGLATRAYRFFILVNNTQKFYINQSQGVANLSSELVNFSFADMGFSGIDINSTVIKDENNASVPYEISGENIRFSAAANASQHRWFLVSFDDDSNFTSRSVSVSAANNISETIFPVERLRVLQYRQISQLKASNYTSVRSRIGINDFHIKLTRLAPGAPELDYGAEEPRRGDVVSIQRFVVFQNSTAELNAGRLVVQAW